MGLVYKQVEHFLPASLVGPHVMVEIGSDRGEGSTQYLDTLAQKYNTRLLSVDILPKASTRLKSTCANTDFVVAPGAEWSKEFYKNPHSISVLYLDNFDYLWDINEIRPALKQQQHLYASLGLEMTNQNCQLEHMKQIISLAPFMHPQGTVVFDDTYCVNDCWIGKCGPAVVYMKALGWQVVWHQDCGVIMQKVDF